MNRVYFFFDFDGTLAPIARRPDLTKLNLSTRGVLKELASRDNYTVAIISGRSIADIRRLVGLKGIIYAGNHGLDAQGRGINFVEPRALKAKKLLKEISVRIKKEILPIKGIFFEDKVISLSVHFRLVPKNKLARLSRRFSKIIRPYLKAGKVKLTRGKKVWEIRPPVDWNKGRIVLWLVARAEKKKEAPPVVFYFGDDATDEDAFRALKTSGVTVKVGPGGKTRTHAQFSLKNVGEVEKFLHNFIILKKGG